MSVGSREPWWVFEEGMGRLVGLSSWGLTAGGGMWDPILVGQGAFGLWAL